jgi:EF-P beta-lysylation protein EpmB
MIPQSVPLMNKVLWQNELANAIKDPALLLERLGLADQLQAIDPMLIKNFPLRVPQSYVAKMQYGDKHDPLLRQVFPLIDESIEHADFVHDPVGDHLAITSPGMLQKYNGRALLLLTGACAIHCRYCFRRHFPYSDSNPIASQWQHTIESIKADISINEVIFSGGDPLSLTDSKLAQLVAELDTIPHLKRLRIHTRLPIVIPSRVNQHLLDWITTTRLNVVMVIHANHANELGDDVNTALKRLHEVGCQLLNQAVLLKGVNDKPEILVDLSERLHDNNVMPYYLHLLDRVAGAQHFDVSEQDGVNLINTIRSMLPGYLVPKLVREEQGKESKTPIA